MKVIPAWLWFEFDTGKQTIVSYIIFLYLTSAAYDGLETNHSLTKINIMNPTLKNILAVVAGLVAGGIINTIIISISGKIIPPPEGADVTTVEGIKASIHLFEPKHFLMPFLAHAMNAFVGAFVTAKIAANRHMLLAMIIGIVSLIGGIAAVMMIPAPMWFNITDLALAYLPMAFLGGKLGSGNK